MFRCSFIFAKRWCCSLVHFQNNKKHVANKIKIYKQIGQINLSTLLYFCCIFRCISSVLICVLWHGGEEKEVNAGTERRHLTFLHRKVPVLMLIWSKSVSQKLFEQTRKLCLDKYSIRILMKVSSLQKSSTVVGGGECEINAMYFLVLSWIFQGLLTASRVLYNLYYKSFVVCSCPK